MVWSPSLFRGGVRGEGSRPLPVTGKGARTGHRKTLPAEGRVAGAQWKPGEGRECYCYGVGGCQTSRNPVSSVCEPMKSWLR